MLAAGMLQGRVIVKGMQRCDGVHVAAEAGGRGVTVQCTGCKQRVTARTPGRRRLRRRLCSAGVKSGMMTAAAMQRHTRISGGIEVDAAFACEARSASAMSMLRLLGSKVRR